MAKEVVLKIEDLTFGYSEEKLLYRNFSLTLYAGEIVTILGPSGSGKSTLFELIAGNLKPMAGVIEKAPFSQVFQDPYSSFHPTYTIENQIADVAPLEGMNELCEQMGFARELLEKRPHELSGGQLQRASILRALLMKPRLLLADEPTSALDNLIQLDVMRLLLETLDRVGILMITHDRDLAKWCSDRVVEL
ncbi:ATP-binding cassette domain-containing protein [Hydrogenimonas cancrithermarum]|uniref:ATP-binding cassette domain-containing protein n=1 Tax=Hydrogenimonas cancrithermarum TaxID=2993563 RepID=UPI002574004C|nr:ATP-binding cassette domain-containing protein [Hydrogenimonas cancrithermarum]